MNAPYVVNIYLEFSQCKLNQLYMWYSERQIDKMGEKGSKSDQNLNYATTPLRTPNRALPV